MKATFRIIFVSSRIALFSALIACSSAVGGGSDDPDGGPTGTDADLSAPDAEPQADAEPDVPIDGGIQTITLQAGTDNTVTPLNSISCNNNSPNFFHTDNRYFRTYPLSSAGVTTDFVVSSVDVGIQEAAGAAGTQPITVSIYSLDGQFVLANLTQLASENLNVPDQTLTTLNVPIVATVPAGSTMVVEVFSPDGVTAGNRFFIGSNVENEAFPSFIVAPGGNCNVNEPTEIDQISPPQPMRLVLNVTGDHTSP